VKETRIDILVTQYERFQMQPGESITQMFNRLQILQTDTYRQLEQILKIENNIVIIQNGICFETRLNFTKLQSILVFLG